MTKIIENPATNYLTESMQAIEMKFSFAKKDKDGHYQMLHQWCKCREYFNEILMKNHHPEDFTFHAVYGMTYEYNKYPLDMNETCVAVKFPESATKELFLKNLPLIHKVEDINNVEHTTVETDIEGRADVVILHGNKFWMQKCILFNIYTLLVKLCSLGAYTRKLSTLNRYGNTFQYFPTELTYIKQLDGEENLVRILYNLQELLNVPTKYVDGSNQIRERYEVHGCSGIVCLWHWAKQVPKYWSSPMETLIQSFVNIMKCTKEYPKTIFGVK